MRTVRDRERGTRFRTPQRDLNRGDQSAGLFSGLVQRLGVCGLNLRSSRYAPDVIHPLPLPETPATSIQGLAQLWVVRRCHFSSLLQAEVALRRERSCDSSWTWITARVTPS